MPILAIMAYGMNIDGMRFILGHGADPNHGFADGVRPLDIAFFMQRGYAPAKLLLEYGADPKLCKDQQAAQNAMREIGKDGNSRGRKSTAISAVMATKFGAKSWGQNRGKNRTILSVF